MNKEAGMLRWICGWKEGEEWRDWRKKGKELLVRTAKSRRKLSFVGRRLKELGGGGEKDERIKRGGKEKAQL